MSQRRVAITGLGLVSPYGGDLADFFTRLAAGESAVRYLLTDDLPRPLSIPFVSCPGFDPDAALGRPLASMMDRFAQLGMAAAFGAWDDAGLPRQAADESRDSWGVAWGTALGGTLAYEKGYRELWQKGRERLSPLSVVLGMNNAANAHISIQLGLGGVSMSHTVACASSSIAIGEAFRRVRSGEATIMVTGGSDVPQAYGVARAWEALRVMAPGDAETSPAACRPSRPTAAAWSSARAGRRSFSKTGTTPLPAAPASTARWSATARVATTATWSSRKPPVRSAPCT